MSGATQYNLAQAAKATPITCRPYKLYPIIVPPPVPRAMASGIPLTDRLSMAGQ